MPRTPLQLKAQPQTDAPNQQQDLSKKRKEPDDPAIIDLCDTSSVKKQKRRLGSISTTKDIFLKEQPVNLKKPLPTSHAIVAAIQQQQLQQPPRKVVRPPVSKAAQLEWRTKFGALFPTFVFYFDAVGQAKRSTLTDAIGILGASIDDFFSSQVTHVISGREINAQTGEIDCKATPPKQGTIKMRGSPAEKNPYANEQSQAKNVLARAKQMNIKIWDLDKVDRVIVGLLGEESPVKATAQSKHQHLSLPHLLRAEALSGVTLERDPEEKRSDYAYFAPKSMYILIEDSTGEHRTIIAKEYDKPRRGSEHAEWPVLYGGVEGRCAFSPKHQNIPPLPKGTQHPAIPKKAEKAQSTLTQPANTPGFLGLPRPTGTAVGIHSLRKTMSLRDLAKKQQLQQQQQQEQLNELNGNGLLPPNTIDEQSQQQDHTREASGFLAASGNSQIITSNIASGTSGAPHAYAGPNNNGGTVLDQRLAQLDRRQVTVAGGNTAAVGLAPAFVIPPKQAPAVQRPPKPVKRTISMEQMMRRKHLSEPEDTPKPGYCENCRLRYDDFKQHCVSRKHRKFARNPNNWRSLDVLLCDVARPIRPEFVNDSVLKRLTYGAPSECCDEDVAEADEQSCNSSESEEVTQPTDEDEDDDEDNEEDEEDEEDLEEQEEDEEMMRPEVNSDGESSNC